MLSNPASALAAPSDAAQQADLGKQQTLKNASFARAASPGVGQRTSGANSPADLDHEDPSGLLPRHCRVRWRVGASSLR